MGGLVLVKRKLGGNIWGGGMFRPSKWLTGEYIAEAS